MSESEFEAVISTVIVFITKIIYTEAGNPALEDCRRKLEIARDVLRNKEVLTPEMASTLDKAATKLREKLNDEKTLDHLWDISDFIEMRLGKA